LLLSSVAGAQSLKGSPASVDKMYTRAVLNDLQFLKTSKSVYESVADHELVMLSITNDMTLDKVSYPFVLPKTRDFVNTFARVYHDSCGERLVVTSAARPRTQQPRNASPKSVHPTGMAVDFRKPSGACLTFLRSQLVKLEAAGTVEATEEHHPVHFHVAVLQKLTAPYGRTMASAARTTATPVVFTSIVPIPTSPVEMLFRTDSANGTVDLAPSAPVEAPKAAAKTSAARKSATRSKTYSVRKGDTISEIAKRFGLTVSRLKSLNGLHSSTIKPGQKLRIG
jgi:LysM repeat protein